MFPRDHAVQRTGQRHDAFDRAVGGLQHLVVVTVDGDIGVHIAVTGVHVQRHPNPAFEHPFVDGRAFSQDGLKSDTVEDALQRRAQLRLPAGAQAVVLQFVEQPRHAIQPALPLGAHIGDQCHGLSHTVFEQLGRGNIVGVTALAQRQVAVFKKLGQGITKRQLVAQAQLDVDALNAVGVLRHARQWDHHVFIDLEGVGVAADGGRLLAIQPKFLACLRADGDKTFAAA